MQTSVLDFYKPFIKSLTAEFLTTMYTYSAKYSKESEFWSPFEFSHFQTPQILILDDTWVYGLPQKFHPVVERGLFLVMCWLTIHVNHTMNRDGAGTWRTEVITLSNAAIISTPTAPEDLSLIPIMETIWAPLMQLGGNISLKSAIQRQLNLMRKWCHQEICCFPYL